MALEYSTSLQAVAAIPTTADQMNRYLLGITSGPRTLLFDLYETIGKRMLYQSIPYSQFIAEYPEGLVTYNGMTGFLTDPNNQSDFQNLNPGTSAQGPQGYQGYKGASAAGNGGLQGLWGIEGFYGSKGEDGEVVAGPQGPQGPMGIQGTASSIPGDKGYIGDTLDISTGPSSNHGLQGPQGPLRFEYGLQGLQGYNGIPIQGPQGATQYPGFYRMISKTEWRYYSYDDIHSESNREIVGAQGPNGEGYRGEPGDDYIGDEGLQGPNFTPEELDHARQIAQGPKGAKGMRGVKGNTIIEDGYQGYQGYQGLQGPKGAQGVQGPKGYSLSISQLQLLLTHLGIVNTNGVLTMPEGKQYVGTVTDIYP